MLQALIKFCLNQRILVLSGSALLIAAGIFSAIRLPIDAVPDITNNQIQINTSTPALSPLEVEKQITTPIEVAMAGLPGLMEVRGLSKFGLSQVTVVFEDKVDIYFARQQVQERLQQAKEEIPPGSGSPEMGPVSTGLGEIFQYTVESPKRNLTELRTLNDWVIKPQLRTVPGVAGLNSFGGLEKQYEVALNPESMVKYGLSLREVLDALTESNVNKGGGYILKGAEQYVVRGQGQIEGMEQIGAISVRSEGGIPVRIRDLATIRIGSAIRQGAVTRDGKGEAMAGIVMMRMGANSRQVVKEVKRKIAEISLTLPEDVRIVPYYDRSELVDRTIRTVERNLAEGALLVVAVLLLLLGNIRAALIVALTIPLSMLFAVSLMLKAGIAGSLMSLGAIDFGLMVDGSVVLVENSLRHLGRRRKGETAVSSILASSLEVGRPVFFGVGIIILVYLPILTLEGVEGKLFRPMAFTVVFALLGSLLLTFTLIPVLVSFFLRGVKVEKESRAILFFRHRYTRMLDLCLRRKRPVLLGAALAVLAAFAAIPFLGSEFVPKLDENAFALEMRRSPGISLEEAARLNGMMEKKALELFPDEISHIVSLCGRPDIATDPMPPSSTDFLIFLKPKAEWKKASSREALIEALEPELGKFLGVSFEFSQPIEMRMNELIAGVRSDLAIKIFGEDAEVLRQKGEEAMREVAKLPGAKGFRAQQAGGLPMLEIKTDPARLARYGINAGDVMETVEALGGIGAGRIQEGQKRFNLVLTFPERFKKDKEAISRIALLSPEGHWVPLAALCDIKEVLGPSELNHEKGSRLTIVEGNVRGRDIGGFVDEVRNIFAEKKIVLPPGYHVEFGGQFENLERARSRLLVVVPLSLALIFLLLFLHFGAFRESLLVFTGIPLAVVGGVAALLVRGMPFSISAGVGFIALFGIAVLNGLVLVSYINKLREEGMELGAAIRQGAEIRLRPVLMTALVASFGFLPMALSHGAGAEVQRPLATVVLGGLVSSTILTLFVLPILYGIYERRKPVGQRSSP
ncbi:MAG: cation efflux protein [Fibrobacteres bacterium]|nr:cation efflux protein [Fibrobacterota bacterium]